MEESPQDLELFHYGVKGMKWGIIRRKPSSEKANGSRSSRSKTSNSSEGSKANKKAKKPPRFSKRDKAAIALFAISTLHTTHPRQMAAGLKFMSQSINTAAAFGREYRYRHKDALRRAKDFAATNGLPRPGDIALEFVDGVWR